MQLQEPKQIYFTKPNSSVKWMSTDGEWEWRNNCAKFPDDKDLLWYKDNPIEYSFNNYGYRTPDDFVEGAEGNAFLGCSHTFGIGHHLKNVWSYKVSKKIGGKFFNLAQPGRGIGTAARVLWAFKDMLKIKNVFLFAPHPARYELYDPYKEAWTVVAPAFNYPTSTNPILDLPDEMRYILADENNVQFYYATNFAFIEQICREIGARLWSVPMPSFRQCGDSVVPCRARDLMHLNALIHMKIAKDFLYSYNNNIEPYREANMARYNLVVNSKVKDKDRLI